MTFIRRRNHRPSCSYIFYVLNEGQKINITIITHTTLYDTLYDTDGYLVLILVNSSSCLLITIIIILAFLPLSSLSCATASRIRYKQSTKMMMVCRVYNNPSRVSLAIKQWINLYLVNQRLSEGIVKGVQNKTKLRKKIIAKRRKTRQKTHYKPVWPAKCKQTKFFQLSINGVRQELCMN